MREGLAIFICRRNDFTEVGSGLNAAKGMHQAGFERRLLRLGAAAP